MYDSIVFLISLNRFFSVQIPNDDLFVIARYDISCSWRKLAISDPIFMFFQGILKSSIDSGPNLDKFVIPACGKQQSIATKSNRPDSCIMSLN